MWMQPKVLGSMKYVIKIYPLIICLYQLLLLFFFLIYWHNIYNFTFEIEEWHGTAIICYASVRHHHPSQDGCLADWAST